MPKNIKAPIQPLPPADCLIYFNHEECLTYQQISMIFGVTKHTVFKWFGKRGIKGKDNHISLYEPTPEHIKASADKNRTVFPENYKGKSELLNPEIFVNCRTKFDFRCACGAVFKRELTVAIKSPLGNICKKCQGEVIGELYSSPKYQAKLKETPHPEKRKYRRSCGEKDLYEFLEKLVNQTKYSIKHSAIIGYRSVDAFIPELNLGIEYNGISFHSEMLYYVWNNRTLAYTKKMHKEKQEDVYPSRLFYVWEDDWKNKQAIVKRQLEFLILGPEKRIFARKTSVKEISSKEANSIYEYYHIQGKVNSSISYGLFFNDELVAAASFTKRKDEHELVRFCSSSHVIGGFSKIVKFFVNENNPEKLYSFADLCSVDKDDNVYKNNGWLPEKILDVDYKYAFKGKREHKFGFRHASLKNKLKNYDPSLTEYQNCLNHRIYRVYDAGKIKYVYPLFS